MKILYTSTAYLPSIGGAQLYLHQVVSCLSKQHVVRVVSLWDTNRTDWLLGTTLRLPDTPKAYCVDGVPVHQIGLSLFEKIRIIPFTFGYYFLKDLSIEVISRQFEEKISQFSHDIDIVHNIRIGREPLSYASLKTARKSNVPFVFTPFHHPRWIGWNYTQYHSLYKKADLVFALTNAEKRTLIGFGVHEDRIVVTGHGPILSNNSDPAGFLEKHDINGPVVLFLGQHYHYKGYKQLLSAAPLIWKQVPETHFIFIGPPVKNSERYFENLSDRRIHRLGTVNLREKTDALSACTLLCVPSTQESFGGVYTEAWNFSKPVIGCDIPAVSELIDDGVDGFLVSQDPIQISDGICYLLLHSEERRNMGARGRNKVEKLYNKERIAQIVEDAYLNIA